MPTCPSPGTTVVAAEPPLAAGLCGLECVALLTGFLRTLAFAIGASSAIGSNGEMDGRGLRHVPSADSGRARKAIAQPLVTGSVQPTLCGGAMQRCGRRRSRYRKHGRA